MIRAALFDMDGVIYDSMKYHAKAWHITMQKYGIPMSEVDCYEHEGMRGVETIKELALERCGRVLTTKDTDEMYERKCECFASFPEPEMMPGCYELMTKMQASGVKIVVVTGSGQYSVLNRLTTDYHGLIHRDLIITCFDVIHGKPAPDPYIMGLERGGVAADEAIVVENAPLGVRAGKAAGIYTVAVNTGPLPDEILAREGADKIYPSVVAFADDWENFYSDKQK